jgi:hypothetical protein
MIRENPHWRIWHTHHGRHRSIFSPIEESSIVSFIRANSIEPGLIFAYSDFREIAINAFSNRMRTPMRLRRRFDARPDSPPRSEQTTICLRGEQTIKAS